MSIERNARFLATQIQPLTRVCAGTSQRRSLLTSTKPSPKTTNTRPQAHGQTRTIGTGLEHLFAPTQSPASSQKQSPLPVRSVTGSAIKQQPTNPDSSNSYTSSTVRAAPPTSEDTTSIADSGFQDTPQNLNTINSGEDWTRSFAGLSASPFSPEQIAILNAPVKIDDVEVKPDGLLYLPEIKYRRILNAAFGPGAWGLAPRGETIVTDKSVTREYALVILGRLVSVARGEQDYFSPEGIPTATEGCKSNALMRCCKDLGIASELWDPVWLRKFNKEHVKQVWVEHVVTKKKKKIPLRKDGEVTYPYKESKP